MNFITIRFFITILGFFAYNFFDAQAMDEHKQEQKSEQTTDKASRKRKEPPVKTPDTDSTDSDDTDTTEEKELKESKRAKKTDEPKDDSTTEIEAFMESYVPSEEEKKLLLKIKAIKAVDYVRDYDKFHDYHDKLADYLWEAIDDQFAQAVSACIEKIDPPLRDTFLNLRTFLGSAVQCANNSDNHECTIVKIIFNAISKEKRNKLIMTINEGGENALTIAIAETALAKQNIQYIKLFLSAITSQQLCVTLMLKNDSFSLLTGIFTKLRNSNRSITILKMFIEKLSSREFSKIIYAEPCRHMQPLHRLLKCFNRLTSESQADCRQIITYLLAIPNMINFNNTANPHTFVYLENFLCMLLKIHDVDLDEKCKKKYLLRPARDIDPELFDECCAAANSIIKKRNQEQEHHNRLKNVATTYFPAHLCQDVSTIIAAYILDQPLIDILSSQTDSNNQDSKRSAIAFEQTAIESDVESKSPVSDVITNSPALPTMQTLRVLPAATVARLPETTTQLTTPIAPAANPLALGANTLDDGARFGQVNADTTAMWAGVNAHNEEDQQADLQPLGDHDPMDGTE